MFHKPSYMKSYNKFYYDKNKKNISVTRQIKRTNQYFDLDGHLEPVHDAIRRYATKWKIPIEIFKKFRAWAKNDSTYESLFKAWEESDFSRELTPVVMRRVKKQGFIITNLYWSVKKSHSWWNGELDNLKTLSKEMEKRQATNNKATEEQKIDLLNRLRKLRK